MSVERDRLERFSKAVYNEVNERIEQILSEAQASRKEILEKTNDASLGEAYDTIQSDMKKIVDKYAKKVSLSELDTKKGVLLHREKLATQVFDNVRSRISDFTKSDEYKDYLVNTLSQELSKTDKNHSLTVYLSKEDMKYENELSELLQKRGKVDKSFAVKLGGFILEDNDSSTLVDCTFDQGLVDAREEFNRNSALRLD